MDYRLICSVHLAKVHTTGAYLLPSRINQDILESFFGLVRGRGGANLHPSPSEAKCCVRRVMLVFALRLGVNPLTRSIARTGRRGRCSGDAENRGITMCRTGS